MSKRKDISHSRAEGRPVAAAAARPAARRRRLLAGSLFAGAAATTAAVVLAFGSSGSTVAPPSPSGGGASEAGGVGGEPVPDFTLTDVDGKSFSLGAQRGKVVVIDFLQAGCPTCAAQIPILTETAERFAGRGVKVVIVELGGDTDRELRDYYRGQYGASRRVVIAPDRDFRAARAFSLSSMMAFVVGRRGDIRWGGMLDRGALMSVLRKELS